MKEKGKKRKGKEKIGDASFKESVRANWLCCVLKSGFLQLISTASLIFKSNLGLALSIISKERESYELKHIVVECRCLKIWDLVSFLICSSILVLKWRDVSPM